MSWARIMAPLSGGEDDAAALAAAVALAEPFGAEVAAVYAPADLGDVLPWMGEGFMGAAPATALETLKEATARGEARARSVLEGCAYPRLRFAALQSPVWAGLAAESRLSDLIVFADAPARGRGPLADTFQHILADEQRPVFIARGPVRAAGCAMVAWDGGKEASRAARLALPLMEKAARVVIASAPKASARQVDPARLQAYYAQRGVQAEIEVMGEGGDVGQALLEAAARAAADVLVAGAFGHPRLQEFIFGGTTRRLLHAGRPSLFLSH